jgi:hypothetical protein
MVMLLLSHRRLRMRTRVILSVVLLFAVTGLGWAQFWKGYSDQERQSVAEAYWLAGAQYQAVGESAKGQDFQALARLIYPPLDPSSIKDVELPSASDLLAQGRAFPIGPVTPVAPPASTGAAPAAPADPSADITDAFKNTMTAILSKDADGALKDMSSNIRFLRLRQTVSKDELKTSLEGYFDKANFPSAQISDSVDMSSIFVDPADSPVDGVSGPVYALNVKAAADLSDSIPFWADYMEFYFHQENGAWSIFAIK